MAIGEKLNTARKDLLDLTLRNPLLNYRTPRARGLRFAGADVPDLLVFADEGRLKLEFLPLSGDGDLVPVPEIPEAPEEEAEESTGEEAAAAPAPPPPGGSLEPPPLPLILTRTGGNRLAIRTTYDEDALNARLLRTHYTARTFLEEQGTNALFLAAGMLQWFESDSAETARYSPLLLIPVELVRRTVQNRIALQQTDEDIETNLSLTEKMRADFGISLPDLPEPPAEEDTEAPNQFDAYFAAVRDAVAAQPRWRVIEETAALDLFWFSRFLIYKDLAPEEWDAADGLREHSILGPLLDGDFRASPSPFPDDAHLDRLPIVREIEAVVDADSSQMLALADIHAGRTLVIQGPPGTGKSQTITNIVGNAIAHGRTVLFVAEKLAALEVVHRRLVQTGLGAACLELHSHKSNKKEVLAQIRAVLEAAPEVSPAAERIEAALLAYVERLNQYDSALNEPLGATGFTLHEILGRLLRLELDERMASLFPKVPANALPLWNREELNSRVALAQEVAALLTESGVPAKHVFFGAGRRTLLPSDRESIEQRIRDATDALRELADAADAAAVDLGIDTPAGRHDTELLRNAALLAAVRPPLNGLDPDAPAWAEHADEFSAAAESGVKFRERSARLLRELRPEALRENIAHTLPAFAAHHAKWYRWLIGAWRAAKAHYRSMRPAAAPFQRAEALEHLRELDAAQKEWEPIRKAEARLRPLLGGAWGGFDTPWEDLAPAIAWMVRYASLPANGPWRARARDCGAPAEQCARHADRLTRALEGFGTAAAALESALEWNHDYAPGPSREAHFVPLMQQLGNWQHSLPRLGVLVAVNQGVERLLGAGAAPLVPDVLTWEHASRHLPKWVEYAWCRQAADAALRANPLLARFQAAAHETAITKFRELDEAVFTINRQQVARRHYDDAHATNAARDGGMRILRRELEKKTRHLAIRRLMNEAGSAVQGLKPVFLMSPISLATFLPRGMRFDLVVFDEASQVRPVEAFGALLRGAQAIVVGDSRQLPPTTFFDKLLREGTAPAEDDEDASVTADIESILGLFVSRNCPSRMLRWHYRSRHESLIAVSNREFYDNRLYVFPSPDGGRHDLGLSLHHLPEAVYDRGRSQKNRDEAAAVAAAVMDHAREHPGLTLGVGTFSTAQQEAVLDAVERARREHPDLEPFFSGDREEPFFVKNLENIQGDERDVILISVGYGRDKDGRIAMNFGPLNQSGGERRLNVLMTRARLRCRIFSNLTAADIDTSRTSAFGVRALQTFLHYAETGDFPATTGGTGEAHSPFEQAVGQAIEDAGFAIDRQVGCAGYFLDIAVLHPKQRGRYVLGIECDGAMYHSARSARDRDRLRQLVLERLGWRIHRVWSTDWYTNRELALERTLEAVRVAIAAAAAPR